MLGRIPWADSWWGSIAGSRGWHAAAGHSWHDSAEGRFPDADVELCPRASETVGLLWHEVATGRMTATSNTAPKFLGGGGRQGLMGNAKLWCCARPQPGRSNLLERILRSPSPVSGSVCDIAEKLNGMDTKIC